RDLSQYVAASNDRLARTLVFSSSMLFPERIALGVATGDVVVVDKSLKPDAPISFPSASEGKWLEESRIAYIRLPSFRSPPFEQTAVDLVRQFASSPNLIVDVRFNGGGTTPGRLMDALMNRSWRSWQATGPLATTLFGRLRTGSDQAPSPGAYSG